MRDSAVNVVARYLAALAPECGEDKRYQTRGVLGGAYRARSEERATLTHLVDMTVDHGETALCKKVKPGMMADEYSGEPGSLEARPTCPTCAKKWDKLCR